MPHCTATDIVCFSAVYKESSATSNALSTVYDQLASQLSRPNIVTFTKVNVDLQTQIAQSYSVTRWVAPALQLQFEHGG